MNKEITDIADSKTEDLNTNHLFPVFLKLENLRLLIVGGGNVGLEKLGAVLHNAPATPIKLVAISISQAIKELAERHGTIKLFEKPFDPSDLDEIDIVITAIDDKLESERYLAWCRDWIGEVVRVLKSNGVL